MMISFAFSAMPDSKKCANLQIAENIDMQKKEKTT